MKYNKEYSSPYELIYILKSRGLDCNDLEFVLSDCPFRKLFWKKFKLPHICFAFL